LLESYATHLTQTFYSAFDVSSYGFSSNVPRLYKKLVYTRSPLATPIAVGDAGQTSSWGQLTTSISTFPLYTAIIQLTRGVVTGITWDDGCFFCAANGADCMANAFDTNSSAEAGGQYVGCQAPFATCYPTVSPANTIPGKYNLTTLTNVTVVNATTGEAANVTRATSAWAYVNQTAFTSPAAQGAATANATSACDLKIFVVWTGTDAAGQYLKSVNKRFSRFRAFSVASAYQSAINIANQASQISQTAVNIAEGIPGATTRGDD
jgi:hypothetical protein